MSLTSVSRLDRVSVVSKYASIYFFLLDKAHILISKRYKLHPASAITSCPNGIKDAHNQKREKNYTDRKHETTTLTPPRQHQ
jgi:hypothetical protein